MSFFQYIFVYVPFGVLAIILAGFVFRSGFRPLAMVAWSAWFLFACSRFFVGKYFYGHPFFPEFSEAIQIFWCWAYVGAAAMALLTLAFWFWRGRAKRWALPTGAGIVAAIGVWNGIALPSVREMDLFYENLPNELDGYRIVQISDVHCSPSSRRWRTEGIVERANAVQADLVCVTGDLVDGWPETRSDDMAPLGKLRAKDGVYFVTGNHEYYYDWRGWEKFYRKLGLRFLHNACVFPRRKLALGGVNDKAVQDRRVKRNCGELPNVGKAFASATNGEFRILLKHRPEFAVGAARKHNVALQLSGHTHGGFMPGFGPLVRKDNDGYLRGLYETGKDSLLYVHSGSGQWAGFQIRYFDDSEIVVFTLRKGKRSTP